jgi:hypothetical protein
MQQINNMHLYLITTSSSIIKQINSFLFFFGYKFAFLDEDELNENNFEEN